jgi:hypothetical protein
MARSFVLSGAVFGLGVGAVNGYVLISLPQLLKWPTMMAEEHHVERWLLQYPGCYGLSILACMLVMAMIWSLAASYQKFTPLVNFCSALVLVSSMIVSFNLVPALWLCVPSTQSGNPGSRLAMFITWWLFSYPVGLLVLAGGLALLEVLYQTLQKGQRTWRGHLYSRWLVLLPAFHWGFFTFWAWTTTATFCFNKHWMYIPPYSPLCVLGVAAGLTAFILSLVAKPSLKKDFHGWVRDQTLDLTSYIMWWP